MPGVLKELIWSPLQQDCFHALAQGFSQQVSMWLQEARISSWLKTQDSETMQAMQLYPLKIQSCYFLICLNLVGQALPSRISLIIYFFFKI